MYSKNNNLLSYDEIQSILEKDDFIIIKNVKEVIVNNNSRNRSIIISDKQKTYVKHWFLMQLMK